MMSLFLLGKKRQRNVFPSLIVYKIFSLALHFVYVFILVSLEVPLQFHSTIDATCGYVWEKDITLALCPPDKRICTLWITTYYIETVTKAIQYLC